MSLMLLGILNSQVSGGGGAFDLLETVTLTANSTLIDFSSIPQDYKHLQIRATSRNTFANIEMAIGFNSDTGNNYTQHYLSGNGSTVTSAGNTAQPYTLAGISARTAEAAGIFGLGVIDILDFTNTSKNTTMRALGGLHSAGNSYIQLRSGAWLNTSAISSVQIKVFGQNFVAGSRFSLYGIKG